MCTRIWWVRPVSRVMSSRLAPRNASMRVVVGDAGPPPGDDREPAVAGGVPGDRGVHRAPQRIRMALHQGVVALVHRALAERPLQRGVSTLALGQHHQPGRVRVQPVDDALPLGGTAGRDGVPGGEQAFQHGRPGPARRRVGRDPGRLVHHHDVGVLVDDGQPRHRLRYRRRVRAARGQRHVQPLPGRHPVRLGRRAPGRPAPARRRSGRPPPHGTARTCAPARRRGARRPALPGRPPGAGPRGHASLSPAALPRSWACSPRALPRSRARPSATCLAGGAPARRSRRSLPGSRPAGCPGRRAARRAPRRRRSPSRPR